MSETKNILISGSSRGLGRELSIILKVMGFNVITMGFNTRAEVDIKCDLLDKNALNLAIRRTYDSFGEIDVLVCNAGTGKIPPETLNEEELAAFFLKKNLHTAQNLISATSPYLKSPGAHIVGISSIAAISETTGAPQGYSKAKKELNRVFQIEALSLASRGIRVNLISPGNIFFEGSRWDEIKKEDPIRVANLLNRDVPLRSFISPAEIADAIVFLSSKSAQNIKGINLIIDGGQIL
jgi:3-oxoacyl-[acyl-carrier protein] reductase